VSERLAYFGTHTYRIGEVTAHVSPDQLGSLVGHAPDAFDPDARAIALDDLAVQVRALADKLASRAQELRGRK
jgi:hypothetical protein